ncbi:MAG TPA: histidine kinase, partial [Pyrinomonadaceae bacterium]|nr:histidine kinase [Pyrinomonadaceae bacterium]
SLIITLWIFTALIYPKLHDLAVWLVDRVILRRADYAELQTRIAAELEQCDSIEECLETIGKTLTKTLAAGGFEISAASGVDLAQKGVTTVGDDRAEITIPTAEPGFYRLAISGFGGGRRLLSEEKAMISAVSLTAARRIDALRVSHERYEREYREREFSRLATEAQLTALRSQINPHFLFNALTTIGYLIRTSPEKAFQTLLHLTKLLRGVLTAVSEFTSLRDELQLIESYLDIERARFEERLEVDIDVPAELESVRIPALVIQPLVENSIKHAVSEHRNGGRVTIVARLADPETLVLSVTDTGAGKPSESNGLPGTGLANIRERLTAYYGENANLDIDISPDGTVATVTIPTAIDEPARRAA